MENAIMTVVRSTEVDMIGHLNNAKYLEYMEWGRVDWLRVAGLPLEEVQTRGILPVMVNINVNFRKEVRLGEVIRVVTRPLSRGNKSFILRHELFDEAGRIVCDADATMVMIDAKARKAADMPEEIARIFATN
ncbi:acyl-CoA thioesterase [Brevibacillus massiliensis]|uniref:acyl-CoA thioesterase n=1 Tax=Brevibacillus massiliensis TaxID=1118054 RepID=UPI000378541C|nr:acyl-CoA thioesterase [Brevibacillus massiliensis]